MHTVHMYCIHVIDCAVLMAIVLETTVPGVSMQTHDLLAGLLAYIHQAERSPSCTVYIQAFVNAAIIISIFASSIASYLNQPASIGPFCSPLVCCQSLEGAQISGKD